MSALDLALEPARLVALAMIVGIATIGFLRLKRRLRALEERHEFLASFSRRFNTYMRSQGKDLQAYFDLVRDSVRMQDEVGALGVMGYKPRAANYVIQRYQVIINLLPAIQAHWQDSYFGPKWAAEDGMTVQEVLTRHEGLLLASKSTINHELHRPLVWFAVGIRTLLEGPVRVLHAFGLGQLVPQQSRVFGAVTKLAVLIVGVITLAASIVTIATGWEGTVKVLHRLVGAP